MKTTITIFILFISNNIIAQNKIDSSKFTIGFEAPYHNTAIFQAPKGNFYLKNTNIFFNALGKNFWDILEIEAGIFPQPFISYFFLTNTKIKIILPLFKKVNFGFGYNNTIIKFETLPPEDGFEYGYEFFAGLTYKKSNNLSSLNFHYGTIQNVIFTLYNHDRTAYSISYIYMRNLYKNWSIISDNKLSYIKVYLNLPQDLGNNNFYLFENILALRHNNNNINLDLGILYYFGKPYNKFKFNSLPYISMSINL